jgi:UDP-2,3-diacylglucosamine pyrophosphatase LpxH
LIPEGVLGTVGLMAKSLVVVLSDVHIGNGAPTVWYQPSVHEPYLVTALEWVVEHKDEVRELVLLGDMFDTWTYPPAVRPPSLADIIAANPATLGADGALAKVVAALPGGVTLLLGNHDGTLTQDDITELSATVGPVSLVDPVHVLTGDSGAKTAFSHGHYWTMFNAPDERSPWNTLPVGHFVTRAFAFEMANKLQPGQTVADLPNMGAPNGFDLGQFLRSFRPTLDPSLAPLLLDYVSNVAGLPQNLAIVLPDGSTTTIADAKRIYDDLFTRWVTKEGGNLVNAARAAFADQWGDYLAWFAQRLALQTGSDLVVMGHTHTAIGGLTVSPVNYINSGFECPSKPDVPPKEFTFTLVDLEHASAEVFQVTKTGSGYGVSVFPAPRIPVVASPAMDFSCYVRIENRTGQPLARGQVMAQHGYWVVAPPQTIPPGGRGDIWLQDLPGAVGTEGGATYGSAGRNLEFKFSCPTGIWSNTVLGPNKNFIAKSGENDWQPRGQVPWFGHPLQVRFTVQ